MSRDPSGANLATNPCGHGTEEYGIAPVRQPWSPGYPAAARTSGKSDDAVFPATSALPVASTAIAVPESASDPPRSVEKISPRPSALNFVTNASGQADTDTNRLKGQLSAFAIRGTALFNGKSLEFVLPARYTLPS